MTDEIGSAMATPQQIEDRLKELGLTWTMPLPGLYSIDAPPLDSPVWDCIDFAPADIKYGKLNLPMTEAGRLWYDK